MKKLQDIGFSTARLAKRILKTDEKVVVEADSSGPIRTFPAGSRERQDQMQKARFPGEYFKITSGGAANNCDNMLIAIK